MPWPGLPWGGIGWRGEGECEQHEGEGDVSTLPACLPACLGLACLALEARRAVGAEGAGQGSVGQGRLVLHGQATRTRLDEAARRGGSDTMAGGGRRTGAVGALAGTVGDGDAQARARAARGRGRASCP